MRFSPSAQKARRLVQSGLLGQIMAITIVEGLSGDKIYNAAALIVDGRIAATHRKIVLPNYAVFDEKRYFTSGSAPTVVECSGLKLGLIICEDAWDARPTQITRAAGADLVQYGRSIQ